MLDESGNAEEQGSDDDKHQLTLQAVMMVLVMMLMMVLMMVLVFVRATLVFVMVMM